MFGLEFIVHRTKMGKAMRAVSFNLPVARLMGINTDLVIAFTFALGLGPGGRRRACWWRCRFRASIR